MRFMPAQRIKRAQIPFEQYRRIFGGSLRAYRTSRHLASLGSLELRLTRSLGEIRAAQRLRYKVFYEELHAKANPKTWRAKRDRDGFDRVCDHLIVLDHSQSAGMLQAKPKLVGTYRLLAGRVDEVRRFYSAGEFDLQPLLQRHAEATFLELGRSCVLPSHRDKRTIELLWRGIWMYVQERGCDVLIGCASLEGTDPERLALPLSFLHHHAFAPDAWSVRALPHRFVEMNRMAREAVDHKAALRVLPPLLKAYLRLGAKVGQGAVVDDQFNTTDVFVVLPVADIQDRYKTHFSVAQTPGDQAA